MTHDQQPDDNWEWESPERRRPRRLEEESAEIGFPIVWVLIGGLAGLLTIGLIGLGVVQFINKRSAPTPTPPGLPTLALPASPTSVAVAAETPTATTPAEVIPTQVPTAEVVEPTDTPEPVAPPDIQVGGYVQIVNTEGSGLSLRAGPGTNNARLVVAEAGSVLPVIGGPNEDEQGETDEDGNIYVWWFVRHTDGTEGWGRADFLDPSLPPDQ